MATTPPVEHFLSANNCEQWTKCNCWATIRKASAEKMAFGKLNMCSLLLWKRAHELSNVFLFFFLTTARETEWTAVGSHLSTLPTHLHRGRSTCINTFKFCTFTNRAERALNHRLRCLRMPVASKQGDASSLDTQLRDFMDIQYNKLWLFSAHFCPVYPQITSTYHSITVSSNMKPTPNTLSSSPVKSLCSYQCSVSCLSRTKTSEKNLSPSFQ